MTDMTSLPAACIRTMRSACLVDASPPAADSLPERSKKPLEELSERARWAKRVGSFERRASMTERQASCIPRCAAIGLAMPLMVGVFAGATSVAGFASTAAGGLVGVPVIAFEVVKASHERGVVMGVARGAVVTCKVAAVVGGMAVFSGGCGAASLALIGTAHLTCLPSGLLGLAVGTFGALCPDVAVRDEGEVTIPL